MAAVKLHNDGNGERTDIHLLLHPFLYHPLPLKKLFRFDIRVDVIWESPVRNSEFAG